MQVSHSFQRMWTAFLSYKKYGTVLSASEYLCVIVEKPDCRYAFPSYLLGVFT